MKRIFKKATVLALTGCLALGYSFDTLASQPEREIKAVLSGGTSFNVLGHPWIPTEEDGSTLVPIRYKDRIYLPVRALAEATGLNVGWEEASQTVTLDPTEERANKPVSAQPEDKSMPEEDIVAQLAEETTFKVSGEPWNPKEADGSAIVPIRYKDRIYLPVRALAEATGLIVEWDEAAQTVRLDRSTPSPAAQTPAPVASATPEPGQNASAVVKRTLEQFIANYNKAASGSIKQITAAQFEPTVLEDEGQTMHVYHFDGGPTNYVIMRVYVDDETGLITASANSAVGAYSADYLIASIAGMSLDKDSGAAIFDKLGYGKLLEERDVPLSDSSTDGLNFRYGSFTVDGSEVHSLLITTYHLS